MAAVRHHTSILLSVSSSAAIAAMILLAFLGPKGLFMADHALWKLLVVLPTAIFVNLSAERFLRTRFERGHEIADQITKTIGGTAGKVKVTILFAFCLELLSVMCEEPTNVIGLIAGIALPFCITAGWLLGAKRSWPARTVLGTLGGLVGSFATVYLAASFFCFSNHKAPFFACLALEDRPPHTELAWLVAYGTLVGFLGSLPLGSRRELPARVTVKLLIATWLGVVALHNLQIYASLATGASSAAAVIPEYVIPVELALLAQLVGWSIALVADRHVAGCLWPHTDHCWRAPRALVPELSAS